MALIIVSHNSQEHIIPLLESIPDAAGRLKYETIVVDNDSTDNTRCLLRSRNDCRFIESENVGYSAAINRGVREAGDAQTIVVLNPDLILLKNCLIRLTTALLENDTHVGIVVPKVLDRGQNLQFSLRREPTLLRALGMNWTKWPTFSEYLNKPADYSEARRVDWALGAAMAFRTEVFNKLRGWDESFFLYSEETDFCLRARDIGSSTHYVPEAVVLHEGGGSGRSSNTHAMQIINRVRLYHKRHSTPASFLYYVATIASEFTWMVRGNRQSRYAVAALLRPRLRPTELRASGSLLPK